MDATFGGDGIVTAHVSPFADFGEDVAIQADGKIVALGIAGGDNPQFGLARFDTDGTLDPTFGAGGVVTTDFTPIFDRARSLDIQSDGKIVAVGGSGFTGGGTRGKFALARYKTDGALDATFGGDGKVTGDLTGFDDIGSAVALQPDAKIVVAGVSGIWRPKH